MIPKSSRVSSVDALRGLIMIVMALDHVRDFFHRDAMVFSPTDLGRTSAALFFTRWITHFCAPGFFFLAGVGAWLWLSRPGRTKAGLSRFLWTRGIWLIILELTVLRFAFLFGITNGPVLLTILWALGASMIILAALCHLPVRVLAPLSLAVILLHNLFDRVPPGKFGAFAFVWNILHAPGFFTLGGVPVVLAYPLVPWFAVMAAGFCFGTVLTMSSEEQRRRVMFRTGLAATAGFLVLRGLNIYGDPVRWSNAVPGTALLSFLNLTKYPPSLLYLLMTLGPALIVLAWFDRFRFSPDHPLMVIGRVPLFFFLGHFLLGHLLAIPFAILRYGRVDFLSSPIPSMLGPNPAYPADFGYSLPVVYLVWVLVVLLMYPLCIWVGRVKQRRTEWWLSYL